MRPLIANKVNTNMCSVLIKLYIVHTILCATVQTCTMYTTMTTTIIACSLFFSAYNLFVSIKICWLDLYSGDLQPRPLFFICNAASHKVDWIIIAFSSTLSCPFIVQYHQSNECSWCRGFVFSPSRELYREYIVVCVHIVIFAFVYLSIPFSLMLVVVGLLGTNSIYLSVYTLFLFAKSYGIVQYNWDRRYRQRSQLFYFKILYKKLTIKKMQGIGKKYASYRQIDSSYLSKKCKLSIILYTITKSNRKMKVIVLKNATHQASTCKSSAKKKI